MATNRRTRNRGARHTGHTRPTARPALVLLIAASVAIALVASSVWHTPVAHAAITTARLAPAPNSDTDSYAWLNYFRQQAGEPPIAVNSTLESQESQHVRYLADSAQACETNVHDEQTTAAPDCPRNPAATAIGKAAANNSNITRMSADATARTAFSNWFGSSFHALTLLDPRLSSTGYASYYTPTPAGLGPLSWRFTAGIDVYRDRSGSYNGSVLSFPANGGVTPLLSYALGTESPEPFRDELPDAPCKSWSNKSEVSAPVIVQWPQKAPSAQISAASGQLTDVSTGTVLSTCSVLGNSFADGSTARILMNAGNGITNAAFYYANVPFVAGHRYRLVVDGQAVTTFTAVTIKSAPTISVTGGDNTAAVQMDDDSTPTFRTLQLFTGANCAGGIVASWHPLGAVVTQSLGTLKSGSTYSVKSYSTDRFGSARWSNCVTFAPL